MADKLTFELVSPERLLLSVAADMVVVPGTEGDFGVLAGHQPLISVLRPGAIEIFEGDRVVERVYVAGGFAEVSADRLTVLAEEAVAARDVDSAAVGRMMQQAKDALGDAGDDEGKRQSAEDRIAYLELLQDAQRVN